ncbi:malonyl CoA-acyl carrier protein transacylase [Calothrix sp. NIES-4071]|nr:malonyl CoA-acyl carrier protein transacylase [Calothrix sp. NIES-4071]BAZ62251.1 malonyl CoA-acyl carrier protein transacylase [Calothrix sp. NIES-4105]
MTKTAWVFPGQGSQTAGMGIDILDLPACKDKFTQAEEILGWSVVDVCQDEEKLASTVYTQPCLYVIESILSDLLSEKQKPDLVAGHSLGEYVALYSAGVFEWSTGLRLVKRRAELMQNASGGMMAALMNFDREQLSQVISETPDVVLANDNSPAQVVISGTENAVQTVMSKVKARRAIPLNVSGAFHSPLMRAADNEYREVLESVEFQTARCPVLSNVEPTPSDDANELKQRLLKQMTGSVRWREIALAFPQFGIEKVIEIGPGNVLTGLIKRTCSDLTLENIRGRAELPE